MTPALAKLFLAALAACNAHATQFVPFPSGFTDGFYSKGIAWKPGFESCAQDAPRMAVILSKYFETKTARDLARELKATESTVRSAHVALGRMPEVQ